MACPPSTSFGNGGIAEIDFEANGGEHFNDLIVQSDGKIVAVGGVCIDRLGSRVTTHGELPERATTARFNADGTIDTAFAIAGGQHRAEACFRICKLRHALLWPG